MATSAFRSTTRRTSIGGDTNSNPSPSSTSPSSTTRHRRSRSVSRFSHRTPADDAAEEPSQPSASRKGKFVNTVRGSGFPEISLDDLAIEMLSLNSSPSEVSSSGNNNNRRGRSSAKESGQTAAQRRGRSVSRRGSRVSELRSVSRNKIHTTTANDDNDKNDFGTNLRRRRSLSVVSRSRSHLISDSEKNRRCADAADLSLWNRPKPLERKPEVSNQQRRLRRCSSQKDLLSSYDGYSSYSSTLTDDEGIDACHNAYGIGKAPHVAYKQNKGLQASSRNRNKLPELASNDGRPDCDVLKAVSTIRRSYNTKLEESEKRKQELLAEIMLEEERGKELKKLVGDFLPNPKETSPAKRPIRGRKRSNDISRVSKQLVEEADKIIENFISSVEESDISSFDGERSDTSSMMGGTIKPMLQYGETEAFRNPLRSDLLPGEMDGVILPWLKWETGDDGTPLLRSDTRQHPATPKTVLQDALEDMTGGQEQSVNSKSSSGSWSPGVVNSFCMDAAETSKNEAAESSKSQCLSLVPRRSLIDIDDYLKPPSNENILSEMWRQRDRIESGGLLICNGGSLGFLL